MRAVTSGARHECLGAIQCDGSTGVGGLAPLWHGNPGGAAGALKHSAAPHPGEIAGDFHRTAVELIIAATLGFTGKRGNALPAVVGRAEFGDGAVPRAISGA